jgi:hypothetical protein
MTSGNFIPPVPLPTSLWLTVLGLAFLAMFMLRAHNADHKSGLR